MKLLIFSVLFIFNIANLDLVYANTQSYTEVECTYEMYKGVNPVFTMKGVVRLDNNVKDGSSYLTLEPPISAGYGLTARILMTRFKSKNYYPVTIHPRGDTVRGLASGDLAQDNKVELYSYLDGVDYYLSCKVIS